MNEILSAKASCRLEFKMALIQSAGKELVLAVRTDICWSFGPGATSLTKSSFYPGENTLGRLLEDIRNSLTSDVVIVEKKLTENKNVDSVQMGVPEPLPKICCCCLPTPMALASGGVRCSRL